MMTTIRLRYPPLDVLKLRLVSAHAAACQLSGAIPRIANAFLSQRMRREKRLDPARRALAVLHQLLKHRGHAARVVPGLVHRPDPELVGFALGLTAESREGAGADDLRGKFG